MKVLRSSNTFFAFAFLLIAIPGSCLNASTLYESIAEENLKSYPSRKPLHANFESMSEWMKWELEVQEHPEK